MNNRPTSPIAVGDEDDQNDDDDDDHSSKRKGSSSGIRPPLLRCQQIDYADPVGDDLRCASCGEVLREDVVQSACGHRIDGHCYKKDHCRRGFTTCHKQMLNDIESSHRCPQCCTFLDAKRCWRDVFAEKQIGNIHVYCPAKQHGCSWIGKKKLANEHASSCPYVQVVCPSGCNQMITRSQLHHHVQQQCESRLVQCELCKDEIEYKNKETHLATVCGKEYVECHNNCEAGFILREQLCDHLKHSSKRSRACSIVNCNEKMSQDRLDQHCETSIAQHVLCVNDGCISIKALFDVMRASLDDQVRTTRQQLEEGQTRLQTLIERAKALADKVREFSTDTKVSQQQTLERCYHAVDGLQNHIRENMSALDSHVTQMTQKLLKLEETILMQDVRIKNFESGLMLRKESDGMSQTARQQFSALDKVIATHDVKVLEHSLRIDMMDCKNTNGVLLWKITEMRRRRRDAVSSKTPSIYSQPFYSSLNGYKMCARLFLNGDGMGRGSHLSLFFVLMRGEYDGLLSWPFTHKVTLMLLGQDGRQHISS